LNVAGESAQTGSPGEGKWRRHPRPNRLSASFPPRRGHIEALVMQMLFGLFNSPYDWAIILVIVLLLFGNRMPQVMRNLGKGVTEFKKGVAGVEDNEDEPGKSGSAPTNPEQKPA
jgi:sec-independent protein translocase protein TatA